ncbi:uncharacterized protein LOC131709275 [Acipenser ruthenus]|uniref:uncharacterized protein LOC131709275 n=1 Tax=Acipenser ruthenus TaxID=7906 RepID=UPI0027422CC4|nr:uncharacterized protein LOC131709275 [Acipenser ruthenus]
MKCSVFFLLSLLGTLLCCFSAEEELSGALQSVEGESVERDAILEDVESQLNEVRGKKIEKDDKKTMGLKKKINKKEKINKKLAKKYQKPKAKKLHKQSEILQLTIDTIPQTLKQDITQTFLYRVNQNNRDNAKNNLIKWGTWDKQDTKRTYTINPEEVKNIPSKQVFEALTNILDDIPDGTNIKLILPLSGNDYTVNLRANYKQITVQTFNSDFPDNTCCHKKYKDLVSALLKGDKVKTDSEVAGILLDTLESKPSVDTWKDFTEQQKRSAVEFLLITQVAEAMVPENEMANAIKDKNVDLKTFKPKTGRVPGMDVLARYFLELIKANGKFDGTPVNFQNVFGNNESSFYIMAGDGGTYWGRKLMQELLK